MPEDTHIVHTGSGDDHLPGDPAVDDRARERREALSAFWETVRRLPAYGRLVVAMARDPRVPNRARVMLAAGGAYLVSPIDLVPGIIPVAGQIDDVYVVLLAIRQALRTVPADVADAYLERYQLDTVTIDSDLATIRRLVRVGVTDSARWGWKQLGRLGRRLGDMVARRRGET